MNPSSFDWKGANKIRDVVTVPALLGTRISHALLILSAADLEAAVTEAAETSGKVTW